MHYHDPDRPRSAGGLPQFLHPGWGIIPLWEVRFGVSPAADGVNYVEVSVWLLTSPTSASRRSCEIELTELNQYATEWLEDPEAAVMGLFGYSGPRATEPWDGRPSSIALHPPGASGAPSLEDLDL